MNYFFSRLKNELGLLLPFIFFVNIILTGLAASYLAVKQMYWVASILLLLLFFSKKRVLKFAFNSQVVLLSFIFYLAINWLFITQNVELKTIAVKDYLIPTAVALFATQIYLSASNYQYFYRCLRGLVFVQLPFVILQFFITARNSPLREFDWDMISGTFGFNAAGGGGNSSGLLIFLCYFCCLAIKKMKLIGATKMDYLAVGTSLMCVSMMETKVAIMLIPLIILSSSSKKELVNPIVIFKYSVLLLVIFAGLLINYNSNFSTGAREGRTLIEYVGDINESYFKEDVINYDTGEVSRQLGNRIWLTHNIDRDGITFNTLFGYGLTSSKISPARDIAAINIPTNVNFASTQTTIYLWDIGIVGVFILFAFMMVKGYEIFRIKAKTPYEAIFRSGALFLIPSFLLFSIYSTTTHVNPITFTVFLFLLMTNFKDYQRGSL